MRARVRVRVTKQAYKVLGSFDFLGNPVSLVSNLGTGVKDFFFQPIQAFATNPKDIGAGLSKVPHCARYSWPRVRY